VLFLASLCGAAAAQLDRRALLANHDRLSEFKINPQSEIRNPQLIQSAIRN
jgi:hypothetical protein